MELKLVKGLIAAGEDSEAHAAIIELARATTDYAEYVSLCRLRKKIGSGRHVPGHAKNLRIAVLGGATTDFLVEPIKLELETLDLGAEIFVSDYNAYVPEMLDGDSRAAAFEPDLTLLLLTPFNITDWPAVGEATDQVEALVENMCDHWLSLCETFHAHTKSEIILGNMHLLPSRATGNLGAKLPWDRNNFIRQINRSLSRKAPDYVHIFDIDTLSSLSGIDNWFDPRFWYHSKQPVSFACIVPFVRGLASLVGALYGRAAKCVVLDLDNTLWGGVVGDDGIEGLKIGEGDAQSEAFKAFQEYVLLLKQRGVLLAVCSKNDEANALEAFEQLPEMVLKRDDFVAFVANWEPKSDNIASIADDLNIGLDAIVFVDDNPAERELVRQALPDVRVVELTEDPAEYPRLLDRTGWLELARLTDEDKGKTDQYLDNRKRRDAQAGHGDYDAYLKSLDQRAIIRDFEPLQIERITQLINKTNQFNLTTKRLSRSEVEALASRPDGVTAYVRLTDRFGDNGVISVFGGRHEGDILYIDLWLMSCRVFKRGVEHLLANYLFDVAKRLGANAVEGVYVPTAKNKIVETLYSDLGFSLTGTGEEGGSIWRIRTEDYVPKAVHISQLQDAEE